MSKKTKNKRDLTKGSIQNHLIRLTVPMIWGILSIISFQLVDTFYISMLGTQELAAISFTFPLTYLIFSIIMGFGIAMSSVVSRLIGEGKEERIRSIASHGLILIFIISVLIAALGLFSHDYVFTMMGSDLEMLKLIRDYMHIWFIGNIFVAIPLVGNSAMRATGDSLVPALIMCTIAIMNLILDPILIFGLLGAPRLELQGAALSTVISNFSAMCVGLYVLGVHKKLLCNLRNLRLDLFKDSAKRLLAIALPVGLTNAIQPFINAVILALLAKYGAEAVAAFGVASRIEAFSFIILMALATGMAPIIGQNWGAQKFDRVHETLQKAIGFNVFWSLFIALVLITSAKPVANLFSDNETVIGYTVLFFWIVPITYAFGNLVMGWASAFNAMGMPKRSFVMIASKSALLLPAVYIGSTLDGVRGIFIAIATTYVITGLGFHIWNSRTCKRKEQEIKAGC